MEDNSSKLTGIFMPSIQQEKISSERVEKSLQILDELILVVSGRDYRYQEITDDHLYEYCEKLHKGLSVSKSYFVAKILSTVSISSFVKSSVIKMALLSLPLASSSFSFLH